VQPQEKGAASERLEDERGEEWGKMRNKGEGKKKKERENYLQHLDMRKSTKRGFSASTTVATIVILNTATDATVTPHLQHPLISTFPSQAVLAAGGGGVIRRSGELPTSYLLLSFLWSWSPATATPSSPLPSRKLGWGKRLMLPRVEEVEEDVGKTEKERFP
jgi:hypothetical protein